jgi:hypothetical protein
MNTVSISITSAKNLIHRLNRAASRIEHLSIKSKDHDLARLLRLSARDIQRYVIAGSTRNRTPNRPNNDSKLLIINF